MTNNNVKERIIESATTLFAKKGYDGAKMSEIANETGINKALIYYYFPSKQAIIEHIIDSFLTEITDVAMPFVIDTVTRMIKEKRLDVLTDRYHFKDKETLNEFRQAAFIHYEIVLDKLREKKDILQIVFAESLREGDRQDTLYQMLMLFEDNERNPLFQKVYEADSDAYHSRELIFRKFFFVLIPVLSLVIFYESYKKLFKMDDTAMKQAYLHSLEAMWDGHLNGLDYMTDAILVF